MINKIYELHVSNDFAPIAPVNQKSEDILPRFNMHPLLDNWEILNYEFQIAPGGNANALPDLSLVVGGGLVFRRDLKEQIFPFHCDSLEFLPIRVAGQDWLLLNCLTMTSGYDSDESVLYRGLEGDVFMVIHLVVTDATLVSREIFVIEDSNRAFLYVFPTFVDRIESLRLKGLTFKERGVLHVTEPAAQ